MNKIIQPNSQSDDDWIEVIDCSDWTPCVVKMRKSELNLQEAEIVTANGVKPYVENFDSE